MEKEGKEGSGPTLLSEKWKYVYRAIDDDDDDDSSKWHNSVSVVSSDCVWVCGLNENKHHFHNVFHWMKKCQSTRQTNSCSSLLSSVHLKCEFLFVDRKIPFEFTNIPSTHERIEFARVHYTVCSRDCIGIQCHFLFAFIYLFVFQCVQSVWLIGCVWCMTDSDTLNIICISDYRQTECSSWHLWTHSFATR